MKNKILIVEDNILNMKLFNDLLQAHGYETLQATRGTNVLELTHETQPDLILMDIQLPDISGLELTKMIRTDRNLNSVTILAITALAMINDEETILEGGCDGYIAKPICVTSFLATVAEFLTCD